MTSAICAFVKPFLLLVRIPGEGGHDSEIISVSIPKLIRSRFRDESGHGFRFYAGQFRPPVGTPSEIIQERFPQRSGPDGKVKVENGVLVVERWILASAAVPQLQALLLWSEHLGDPTLADSILDRLVHNAHRIEMRGESMRKKRGGKE